MQVDSEDIPMAHMHPVLSDAPKSGEALDSCLTAGSNADAAAAESHSSPEVNASLLFASRRTMHSACDHIVDLH